MAHKIKQSPKLPAETRREQLLDSARSLFVKKGYRLTTTDEIARSAGLTKGALYFHFKRKEDILFELIRTIWDASHNKFESDIEGPSHPTPILEVLLNCHDACQLDDYWDMIDLWIQGLRIPRIKRYIGKRIGESMDDFASAIDPRFGNRKQRAQLALSIAALCDGLSFLDHIYPQGIDKKSQVKLFHKMVQGLAIEKGGGKS